MGIYNTRNFTY